MNDNKELESFIGENLLHGKTAEYVRMAWDKGAHHATPIAVARTVDACIKLINEHADFNHLENRTTLINQINQLKKP